MSKIRKYGFLLIACFTFSFAKAQDSVFEKVVPNVMMDSVYVNQNESTVDEFQFREIKTNNIDTRNVSADELNKVKSDEDYWYVNQKPEREKEEPKKPEKKRNKNVPLFQRPWFTTLMWILLIGGFIGLLVWILSNENISLFKKKPRVEGEAIEEESTEDIFEMNFERELQKAIDAKNFRVAVRLMYLRTLRDLSNKNLIKYTHERTNSDYLFQLAGTNYYKNFFKLTRSFDYTWYGQFQLSQDSFALIQNDFNTFKQQLS